MKSNASSNIGNRRIKRRFLTPARKKAISASLALVLALSMPFAYATEGGDVLASEPVAEAQAAPVAEPEATPAPEPAQGEPEAEEPEAPAPDPEPTPEPEGQGQPDDGQQPPATPAGDEPAAEGAAGEAGQVEPAKALPLYIEATGSFFDGGDSLAVKLQVLKDGSFQDVKSLELADSAKSDPIESLEAGTYRVVLADEVEGAEVAARAAVDGVEVEADYERGFEFDPEKGALLSLTVDVATKAPEPEPAPEADPAPQPEPAECSLTFKVVGNASARLVHADGTEVTIGAGESHAFTGVLDENVQIYGTTPASSNVTITVVDAGTGIQTGGIDSYAGVTEFFREVSFTGSDRVVTIDASERAVETYVRSSTARIMAPMARGGNASQPEVGDVFSGSSTVTHVQVLSSGGMTGDIKIRFTSGILSGESNVIVHCDDHGRARPVASPGNVWSYTYTITSVDKSSGRVTGSLLLEGTGEYVYRDGYQRLAGTTSIWRSYQGTIGLDKDSTIPDLTEGNPLYSLEGAEYGIYGDPQCTNLIQTLVTDADGRALSEILDAGTYYVKEIAAPLGFCLDKNTYPVRVSGGTTYVNGGKVYDEPGNDPAVMWAGKIDKETTQNMPQGSASLAGAEFTVRYYAGFFDTAEEAEASGTLMRTWVVSTNNNGFADLSDNFLVGGDSLYKNDLGQVIVPLGTIVIQETKAPEGYLVNGQVFVRQVTEDGITGTNSVAYNAPIVEEQVIRGGISVTKTLEGGENEELEGIAFFIYSSAGEKMTFEDADGNMTDRLVLDESGFASTAPDALVYDTYTVVEDEASVPDDIIWYGDAQGEGSAVVGEVSVSEPLTVYDVDVVNYKKPTFDLIKVDGDSLRDEGSEDAAAKVAGSEWKLEFDEGGSWKEIGTYETDENGRIEFGGQAISKWGTYRLTEVLPADVDSEDGYMFPHDAYEADSVEFAVDASTWEKFESGAYEGEEGDSWTYEMVDGKPALVHGAHNWHYRDIEVVKADQETGEPVANTAFELYRYVGEGVPAEMEDGYRSESHELYLTDPGVEIDEALWEKVAEGVTDENGSHIFRGLTFGYYMTVEELPAPEYAYWWESAESSWATYFFEVGELEQRQVQVYENMKITLETTVEKSTIERTSAGFTSLPGQNVAYDNVNVEQYRYDVSFTNGETNVRADQYSVIDECEFTGLGLRLATLTTPTVANDTDGTFNVWYQTNLTDPGTTYSSASATASNPENEMADGTDRVSTAGWKLWAEGVPADGRQTLSVEDLGLAEGEHVTRLMLEFGSVEVGFASVQPMSYMVYSTEPLPEGTVIPNTATSHITRNWNGGAEGDGLYDDAADRVETLVIGTFTFEDGTSKWTPSGIWSAVIGQTGDGLGLVAAVAAAAAALGATVLVIARRKASRGGSDN